ncbi:DUF4089 domain-containing protein [Ramlibacter sp.]|uniref:DUF4089 domain-containing protein n=1 Tax=Ramlibacter sp. TaxID=1917967 RepID=UPI003D0AB8E7
MDEAEVLQYVQSSARALGLSFDEARAQAVALHFGRTVAIARVLETAPLAPHDEIAEIYRPAPFPPEDEA